MIPDASSESRSYNMSRIGSRNTRPELKVRRWLHAHGFRYRVNVRRLPGSPDIVLTKYRTCVFVNGCFWHGHDGCPHYTHPRSNPEFWDSKVRRNKMRDSLVTARLESMGWKVITVWECQLKRDRFDMTMQTLAEALTSNQGSWEAERASRISSRQSRLERIQKRNEALSGFSIPRSIQRLAESSEED